jgi:hypothetical protein
MRELMPTSVSRSPATTTASSHRSGRMKRVSARHEGTERRGIPFMRSSSEML